MPYKETVIGIYKIANSVNNKAYIGSSLSVMRRFCVHRNLLKTGKHYNKHLQSAWNKYKEGAFIFSIVEITTIENLQAREEFHIAAFKSNEPEFGYNKRIDCKTNLGIKASAATKLKLSLSHMGHKRSAETQIKISNAQYRPVRQMDKDENLINRFASLQEASRLTGIAYQSISGCCRKVNLSAGGFLWYYDQQ